MCRLLELLAQAPHLKLLAPPLPSQAPVVAQALHLGWLRLRRLALSLPSASF